MHNKNGDCRKITEFESVLDTGDYCKVQFVSQPYTRVIIIDQKKKRDWESSGVLGFTDLYQF